MIRSQLRRCFCICCWGDGYIRKIAADEAEVDTAEQESFISAQIIFLRKVLTLQMKQQTMAEMLLTVLKHVLTMILHQVKETHCIILETEHTLT
jgi:hypothetical protein